MENLCCAREHSIQFFVQCFLHSSTARLNLECMGPLILVPEYKDHNQINCTLEVHLHALTLILEAKCGQLQATVALPPSKELMDIAGFFS
jgi:hypothetical protein